MIRFANPALKPVRIAGAADGLGRPSGMRARRRSAATRSVPAEARAFGSEPEFWLRLQMNYDLAKVRHREAGIDVKRFKKAS